MQNAAPPDWQACQKCGEPNPPDAVSCWACYTPQRGTRTAESATGPVLRQCPTCGETNPPGAVMCPACSTQSGGTPWRTPARFSMSTWWPTEQMLAAAGLVALTLCGWLPRRARPAALAAALASGAAYFAVKQKEQREQLADDVCEEPITRIANVISTQAPQNGASRIRLQRFADGVHIDYKIKGRWHEQLIVPLYIWPGLRAELLARGDQSRLETGQLDRPYIITAIQYRTQFGAHGIATETLELDICSNQQHCEATES